LVFAYGKEEYCYWEEGDGEHGVYGMALEIVLVIFVTLLVELVNVLLLS